VLPPPYLLWQLGSGYYTVAIPFAIRIALSSLTKAVVVAKSIAATLTAVPPVNTGLSTVA